MSQKNGRLSGNETGKHALRKPVSLLEEVRQLDPRKQTVCALTLNSEEEKNLFRDRLGEKDFNYIELTNREGEQDDWFMNACRSGVRPFWGAFFW